MLIDKGIELSESSRSVSSAEDLVSPNLICQAPFGLRDLSVKYSLSSGNVMMRGAINNIGSPIRGTAKSKVRHQSFCIKP